MIEKLDHGTLVNYFYMFSVIYLFILQSIVR